MLFGIRPMWRYESQGSFAMVLNAMANWNALDVERALVIGSGRGGRKPLTVPRDAAAILLRRMTTAVSHGGTMKITIEYCTM